MIIAIMTSVFKNDGNQRKKQKLAKNFIIKHLEKNAWAGDTLAGITRYWLEQTRIEIAVEDVACALNEMIKEGRIKAHVSSGETYYLKNQVGEDTSESDSADFK